MPMAAYHLSLPERRTTSVVFASPHSARTYSPAFLRRTVLDERSVRSSEDAFVDRLFETAPQAGAPLIMAGTPRAYVDLNRSADELDPALIEGAPRQGHNPRVTSGLGVIPRVVANGQAIYSGKLSLIEARNRIETIWRPYHAALQAALDEAHMMLARRSSSIATRCRTRRWTKLPGAGSGGQRWCWATGSGLRRMARWWTASRQRSRAPAWW